MFSSLLISAEEKLIPDWIRNAAGWWSEGKISDREFINVLQWLIDEKILVIPQNGAEKLTIINLSEGHREGPLLVEKIFDDKITGLQFLEYPVEYYRGSPVTLQIGESVSNGCTITLKLIKIEGKTATFEKMVEPDKPCPICLSGDVFIETPAGPVNIKDVREGMKVWTLDSFGNKQIGVILQVGSSLVPQGHKMVHLVLDDGREITASPGHPLSDGGFFSDIYVGSFVDDSEVIIVESIPNPEGLTYDILPSGETGLYWANDILVQSTLFPVKKG